MKQFITLYKLHYLWYGKVYKDENNNTQTTSYCKPIDQQEFLHTKSEHLRSLKSSIPYSQALRLKQFALQVQNLIRIKLSLNRSF